VHDGMRLNVANAVFELLSLFDINKTVHLRPGEGQPSAMRWKSVRLLVAPQLEGFRLQCTAQQFAATRWLWRHGKLSVDQTAAAPSALFGFDSVADAAYAAEVRKVKAASDAKDDPDMAAVTVAVDASPLALMRLLPAAKTLVVFFGDSLLYYVSVWANTLLETPEPPSRTSSGHRRRLNLLILCPPQHHLRCRMGQAWGPMTRYYGNGREFNLPRGVALEYYFISSPNSPATSDETRPRPIAQWIKGGYFRFDGLPKTLREHGVDPPQSEADLARLKKAFRAALPPPTRVP